MGCFWKLISGPKVLPLGYDIGMGNGIVTEITLVHIFGYF